MAEVEITFKRCLNDRSTVEWRSASVPEGIYDEIRILINRVVWNRREDLEGAAVGITLSTERQHDSQFRLGRYAEGPGSTYFTVYDLNNEPWVAPNTARICNDFLRKYGFSDATVLWGKAEVLNDKE